MVKMAGGFELKFSRGSWMVERIAAGRFTERGPCRLV